MTDSVLHADQAVVPDSDSSLPSGARKVSWLLGAGIIFIPFIFAWVTLRTGYTKRAKIVAFSWMFIYVLARGAGGGGGESSNTSVDTTAGQPQVRQSAPVRESREQQTARWIDEMRAQGGQCVGVANFVQGYVNQFGVDDWKVTKAFEMASEKGCF